MAQTTLAVRQLHLPMRKPALVRSRNWQHPFICNSCSRFSDQTGRLFLPGVTPAGVSRKKAPKARLCRSCMPTAEVRLRQRPSQRMTPTLAIQMLGLGCPKAYQLRHEHPEMAASVGNAFGTVYHYGRQLCEERSFSEVGYFKTRWGLRNILGKLDDQGFFRHGIDFRSGWEKAAVGHYLDQVFRFLWNRNKLVSLKAYGEALARGGTRLTWWDAELRLPVTDLTWLTEGTGIVIPESEQWGLKGAIDLIILTERDGKYSVKIVDHKIEGVDVHPELQHRDSRLQLGLYACWAMQAFRNLGVEPEDISLWVHELTLNPMALRLVNLPFNRQVHLETMSQLKQAVTVYKQYQREGFPAKPTAYGCQGCDFAFSRLCQDSMATSGRWNLRVPYVALDEALTRPFLPRAKRSGGGKDLGKCPFCHSPLIKGKTGAICSNPQFDDCRRENA